MFIRCRPTRVRSLLSLTLGVAILSSLLAFTSAASDHLARPNPEKQERMGADAGSPIGVGDPPRLARQTTSASADGATNLSLQQSGTQDNVGADSDPWGIADFDCSRIKEL